MLTSNFLQALFDWNKFNSWMLLAVNFLLTLQTHQFNANVNIL